MSEPMAPSRARRSPRRTLGAALLILAMTGGSSAVLAAGPGDGSGGAGGGDDPGALYSDLVVALRDVDGLPILAQFPEGEPTATTEYCVQPVSTVPLPGLDETHLVENEVDGTMVYRIPLMGELDPAPVVLAEEEDEVELCDPQPAYAMYVTEAELERLNMTRTNEDVLTQKLADVEKRLLAADEVALDGAGRLVIDGVVTDAGPEHAALFKSLMNVGTIPGLDAAYQDPLGMASIEPFGPWELAAVSLGSAASKFVPVTIDAAMYYNQITGVADPVEPWREPALVHPNLPPELAKFVNYRDFSYNRAEVFQGCTTWLDVPTLTWHTGAILDEVDFDDLPPIAEEDPLGTDTLYNAAAFAQLAADVRSVVFHLHEREVIAGFSMDSVGMNTCTEQAAALTVPAVDLTGVPAEVVQTDRFPITASLYNPWNGTEVPAGYQLQITVDAVDPDVAFAPEDANRLLLRPKVGETAPTETEPASPVYGDPMAWTLGADGNLVGLWDPTSPSAPLPPGRRVATDFELQVEAGAPTGQYQVTLELVSGWVPPAPALGEDPVTPAPDVETMMVLPDHLTALWTSVPGYVDQDTNGVLTARVFNPTTGALTDGGHVQLTLAAPDAVDPMDVFEPADVTVYSEAVRITMAPDADGNLVGLIPFADLEPGDDTTVTAYVMIVSGAPLGQYELTIDVVDSEAAGDVETMYVGPADSHGSGGGTTTTTTSTTTTTTTAAGGGGAGGGGGGGTAPPTTEPAMEPSLCAGVEPGSAGFVDLTGVTAEQAMAIECLAALGVTEGTTSSTYSPRTSVFRDSMASFLARLVDAVAAIEGMEDVALPSDPPNAFSDDDGTVHEAAINRLAAVGIVNGTTPTTYGPNGAGNEVSRAQMASMLARTIEHLLGHPLPAGVDRFGDDNGGTHEAAINALAAAGVAHGTGPDTYDPSGDVTRAQMATFLARVLTYVQGS